jgi:hypothetical protein
MDHKRGCGLLYVEAPLHLAILADVEKRGLLVASQRVHGSERASALFPGRNIYHDLSWLVYQQAWGILHILFWGEDSKSSSSGYELCLPVT